jgi:hypothetical protein
LHRIGVNHRLVPARSASKENLLKTSRSVNPASPQRQQGKPAGDVRLLLTVFLVHLGSGSPVLAKAQMRHFAVGILANETLAGRGFRACKVRS